MLCTNCGGELQPTSKFCPKCGAPAPAQYTPPSGAWAGPTPPSPTYSGPTPPSPMYGGPMAQPPKSSFGCGKILLILFIILLLLGAGIGVAVYFGYRYTEK